MKNDRHDIAIPVPAHPGSTTGGFITPAGKDLINRAIDNAERQSSGEIVAVVASESDSYLFEPLLWAALAALASAWPFIYLTWLSVHWICVIQIAVFVLLALIFTARPLRYALVPQRTKQRRAHARAVQQFLVQNLHTTEGRTGIMLFVSVAERYAEILADTTIHAKVPPSTWQSIIDRMTSEIGQGRTTEAFVHAIETCATLLAEHFPPDSDNGDVLPNHLIVLN